MGCGSSIAQQPPVSPTSKGVEGRGAIAVDRTPQAAGDLRQSPKLAVTTEAQSEAQRAASPGPVVTPTKRPSAEAFDKLLETRKWKLLMDWCGWHEKDQFGFEQPKVRDILGPAGRSKLGGHERPHEYQVAVSFPGAEFVKGEHGHCSNLTDAEGCLIASNGAEMAEAVRGWLVEDWLGGDVRRGLTHVFIDKLNLQHCAGSVRAVNFGRGNPHAYAVLNENWAIYLREAFLESRVVVFLLNQDWLDSIPCNQEFEGLIGRKATYATDGERRAVIFVDITDPGYQGRLLPQYFAAMRQQAAKYFDVHSFTYNETLTPQQKREVRQSLHDLVQQYSASYDAPDFELEDLAKTTVQWRNWMYFRCLEGTNGWQELVDVQDFDWKQAVEDAGESRWPRPVFQCAAQGVLSRRFRLRVTRLGDGRYGEIQLKGWELFDAVTGQNIVRPGNGYIRAAGGLNPAAIAMIDVDRGAWCHKCGNRQYTWLEWLVPNDQPPVAVSRMRLSQHPDTGPHEWTDAQCPLDFTLECLPVEVWPHHEDDLLRQYEHPMTAADVTNLAGDRPPRWVQLDAVKGADLASGADCWVDFVPNGELATAPACIAYRLRFTEVCDLAAAADVALAGLRLQVVPKDDLRPLGGGVVTGSGGDLPGERCGPGAAFDGNPFSRWVDAAAGGIGNTAVWAYQHTGQAVVEEYTVTSQVGTFGVVDGLHGAPRDWVLYTFQPGATPGAGGEEGRDAAAGSGPDLLDPEGIWVELDRRADIIFTNPRETKRFKVQQPRPGSRYRLVFTAVRCGCASPSMQVGDISLLARCEPPRASEPLRSFQTLLQPSASYADMHEARWAPGDSSCLQLSLPIHPTSRPQTTRPQPLVGLVGGLVQWGGEPISNWYDWPLEFRLQCNESVDGEVVRYGGQATLAYRTDRFQVEYGKDAVWAQLTFEEEVVVEGYGLRNNFEAQPRGEPLTWRFEVWRDGDDGGAQGDGDADGTSVRSGGRWEVLHDVAPGWRYDTHLSCGTFYLASASPPARRFRWVFNEWLAPCPLAELHCMHVLGHRRVPAAASPEAAAGGPKAAADATAQDGPGTGSSGSDCDTVMRFRELACVDLTLLRRQSAARLAGYSLLPPKPPGGSGGGDGSDGGRGGVDGARHPGCPVSWVLEGLTSEYP